MNRIFIVCLLGSLLAIASFGQSSSPRPELLNPKTVEAISADEFRQLIAHHAGKSDKRGNVILVNFWATWCAPCLKELPSLDALEGALGGPDFAVVAVAADPSGPEAAGAFLEKLKLRNLKLYADPKLALAIATGGSAVLPVSILYDAEGREIGRYVGEADWASAEAKALIKAAIASGAR